MSGTGTTASGVVENDLCIGCGYCASLSGIGMALSAQGFLEPDAAMHQSPSDDALVAAACPGRNGREVVVAGQGPAGATDDYMWGRHHEVATGYSTDAQVRQLGSSGGALTGLARWLIASGRVERVLVTTYDPAYAIGTRSGATSEATVILDGAGSKYCPAAPLVALSDLRAEGDTGRVAVIGRPCDVATLRRAIAAGDPVGARVEVLLSFFCAGTPSDTGNRELLRDLGVDDPAQVTRFRHRGNGWPGDTRADLADGDARTCTYNESWGKILRRHVHSLCKICPDGIGEQADIVAADAWYGDDDGYPTFTEADGRSLIIARTPLGQELLNAARTDGAIATEPLDIREIDQMQPGQINRRRQLRIRIFAYRLMGHAVPEYNSAALAGYQRDLSLKARARILVATLRRLIVLRRKASKG